MTVTNIYYAVLMLCVISVKFERPYFMRCTVNRIWSEVAHMSIKFSWADWRHKVATDQPPQSNSGPWPHKVTDWPHK